MKHRARSSKIKYEHHMISGLRQLLEGIEDWPEIKSIIPGRISHTGKNRPLVLKVQYQIETGLKCQAQSRGAVQEVFIVTSKPDVISKKLADLKEVR